jgi:hypothetical protein
MSINEQESRPDLPTPESELRVVAQPAKRQKRQNDSCCSRGCLEQLPAGYLQVILTSLPMTRGADEHARVFNLLFVAQARREALGRLGTKGKLDYLYNEFSLHWPDGFIR